MPKARFEGPYEDGTIVLPAGFEVTYNTGKTADVIHNDLKYADMKDDTGKTIGQKKDGFTFSNVTVPIFVGGWVTEKQASKGKITLILHTAEDNINALKANPAYRHIEDLPEPTVEPGPVSVPRGVGR